jgi:hypothetical protein
LDTSFQGVYSAFCLNDKSVIGEVLKPYKEGSDAVVSKVAANLD